MGVPGPNAGDRSAGLFRHVFHGGGEPLHAQHELGDIVYVDLPKVGSHLEKGNTLGSVESVKAVSDVYAPISGEVTETNGLLADAPEKLNEDPHGAAWLVKLKLSAPAEVASLMTAAEYQTYVGAEK